MLRVFFEHPRKVLFFPYLLSFNLQIFLLLFPILVSIGLNENKKYSLDKTKIYD